MRVTPRIALWAAELNLHDGHCFFFSPPPPPLLVVSIGYFARVCVAVKIHLASGADLSQVAEDPVAVVMRVTTNCQAPHTARWLPRTRRKCRCRSFLVCVCNRVVGGFFYCILWLSECQKKIAVLIERKLLPLYFSVCALIFPSTAEAHPYFGTPRRSGSRWWSVRGLFTYHDGWEWGHQGGEHFIQRHLWPAHTNKHAQIHTVSIPPGPHCLLCFRCSSQLYSFNTRNCSMLCLLQISSHKKQMQLLHRQQKSILRVQKWHWSNMFV